MVLVDKLRAIGAEIGIVGKRITIARTEHHRAGGRANRPYPGSPTDTQAQLVTVLALGRGNSEITETITASCTSNSIV